MDVLKYIDVLIGLALVMLLLSPAVTTITQFLMWAGRARPSGLQKGLRDLILQLNPGTPADYEVAEIDAPSGAPIQLTGFGSGIVPNTGTLQLRGEGLQPTAEWRLTTTPGSQVSVRFLHRGAAAAQQSNATTDNRGVAKVSYSANGGQLFSRQATITLSPVQTVPTTLTWTIRSGPDEGQTEDLAVPAGKSVIFVYPKIAPVAYDLELKATQGGNPAPGLQVTVAFERNTQLDTSYGPQTIDATGTWILPVPATTKDQANDIALQVLLHPMIATPGTLEKRPYVRGNVIEREEFIRILLEFAANEGPAANQLPAGLRLRLQSLLTANGISSPGATLAAIRARAQQLELEKPDLAAHMRQSWAIIENAGSPFVGKINNWFDQAMTRVTHRYTAWARLWTFTGALLVVAAVRMDSLDLLRRLSADDKLRQSLVAEATAYEKRAQDAPSDAKEVDNARAKRDQVDESLAKLREPQLSIIPDHFVWQRTTRARLMYNPDWPSNLPGEFQLALGSATYRVTPKWPAEILPALALAIQDSGAPVTVKVESHPEREQLVLRAPAVAELRIAADKDGPNLLTPEEPHAFTIVKNPGGILSNTQPELLVGSIQTSLAVKNTGNAAADLAAAINAARAGVTAAVEGTAVRITAEKSEVKWIAVNAVPGDVSTRLSDPTSTFGRKGRVAAGDLKAYLAKNNPKSLFLNGSVELCKDGCKAATLTAMRDAAEKAGIFARVLPGDHLVIDSQQLGPIQLRYDKDQPDSNILNRFRETVPGSSWSWPESRAIPGLILSVILLSLGAPFWYDALKDLLKFRPALAKSEEQQRTDRQTDTTPKPAPAKS